MPIDYDQIAQQHGGTTTVDYDALARQHGGSEGGSAPPEEAAQPQPLMSQVEEGAEDFGKGILKGAGSTMSAADDWAREHLPAFMTNTAMGFGKPEDIPAEKAMLQPKNTMQSVGRGVEQAGEFMVPGAGEEAAAAKIGEYAPKLKPLARIAAGALGAGTVNKAQGGGFGAGAAAGGVAGAFGEGLRAVAPHLAESALNIRKLDRAYGKGGGQIGRTILDETDGFTPGSVAESAQNRLDELNPQLNKMADEASSRPRPRVAGILQAPQREVPLSEPFSHGSTRGGLFDAETNPNPMISYGGGRPELMNEGGLPYNAHSFIEEGPPHYLSGSEHPEMSGRFAPSKGTLLTRNPTVGNEPPVDEFGRVLPQREIPPVVPSMTEPNRIASLSSARGVIGNAAGSAARQGERTTLSQLVPMGQHLSQDIAGNEIPGAVTPRHLLDLKRGFGNEFIHRWNPETMTGVKGTAAKTYRAMADEFNNAVPGAKDLNGRISRLIPIAKRAESAELNAPTVQRMAQRLGAHTGALAGGLFGGYQGYEHGGVPGALIGGMLGTAGPELMSSPTGEMAIARALNKARVPMMAAAGSALQLGRANKKAGND